MKVVVFIMVVLMGVNLTGCALSRSDITVHGERVPADVRYGE